MLQFIKKMLFKKNVGDGAYNVNNHRLIDSISREPGFTWFISFPRTGSHWIRMLMELYFEKPSLVEIYYYKDAKEFTCYHHHDINLTIGGCTNVLYLYRDPTDTIYSQLKYENVDINDKEQIKFWTEIYGKHLAKWLFEESFTTKKTVISYEMLKKDMNGEFKKICEHFNQPFDQQKLEKISMQVSKETLKEKIKHDNQVVNLTQNYSSERNEFKKNHKKEIMKIINSIHPEMEMLFGA